MDDRERGSVGLLLPDDGAYRHAMPAIREVLERAGYEVVPIDYDTPNPYKFIVEVDRHDFLLIDVGDGEMPSWLHPVLYGHFVPMVRLLHYETGSRPARSLPSLLLGHAIEQFCSFAEPADRHALRLSIVSLGGELAFGLCSDPEAIPNLDGLRGALADSIGELEVAV